MRKAFCAAVMAISSGEASFSHSEVYRPEYLHHWDSYREALTQPVAEAIRTDDINVAMDCMTLGRIFIGVDEGRGFSHHKAVGKTRIWLLVVNRILTESETALADIKKTDLAYALSGGDRTAKTEAIRKTSPVCRQLLGDALDRVHGLKPDGKVGE